jgi:hypothetical protein
MNTKILQLNSEKQKGSQKRSPRRNDAIVVVIRHTSLPHNEPIRVEIVRRWALPEVRECWEKLMKSLPASERGDFSISFDEAHLNRNARGFGK